MSSVNSVVSISKLRQLKTQMATLNLSSVLEHPARLTPERVAITCGPQQLTYAELNDKATQVAAGLHAMGIRAGDHVALSCPNVPWFPIAYFGILKAGAAVVPLNVLLKPREIAYHLKDSERESDPGVRGHAGAAHRRDVPRGGGPGRTRRMSSCSRATRRR